MGAAGREDNTEVRTRRLCVSCSLSFTLCINEFMLFIQIRSKLFFFRNKERAAAFVAPEEKAKAKTTEVSICYIVETDKDVHPTILI